MRPLRPIRLVLFALAILTAGAGPLSAQDRAMLVDDFERLRGNVLGMVEAMPEAGLRSAPTEGVRDFAQQIEHISAGSVNIVAAGVDAPRPSVGDQEVYFASKAALAAMVNRAFDEVRTLIQGMSDEELMAEGMLFGQVPTPRWKIIQVAHEHGVWTLGATVPYLRLQGATPPGFNLIPGSG